MNRAVLATPLLLLSLGLLAGACNSGDGGASGSNAKAGQGIGMEMDDFYFKPADVSGEAGEEITVELQNEGSATHTFTVSGLNADQVVEPGETATVTVTPDGDGTFAFFCRFHRSQGMEGKLAVGAGNAGGAGDSNDGGGGGSGGGYYGY